MNMATYMSNGNVFVKFERINGVAFKIAALWDKCALLPHICANSAQSRDNCAIFHDRTECLSPSGYTA